MNNIKTRIFQSVFENARMLYWQSNDLSFDDILDNSDP